METGAIAGVDILQAEFLVGEEIPHRQRPAICLPYISDSQGQDSHDQLQVFPLSIESSNLPFLSRHPTNLTRP